MNEKMLKRQEEKIEKERIERLERGELPKEAKDNLFSFFKGGIKNTTPTETIDVSKFLELIKEDTPLLQKIRATKIKKERQIIKEELDYVTFAGTFSTRANNNLIQSSGLACFDYDDFDSIEKINETKKKLIENEYTHCVFNSPSGKGLKLLVKIPEVKDNEEYKKYWTSISNYYNIKETDIGAKDISRACYLSYDPKPYFNPNSQIYEKVRLDLDERINKQIKGEEKDASRSGLEYRKVLALLRKGKSRAEIYEEMKAYSRWKESPEQYRSLTFEKAENFYLLKQQGEEEDTLNLDYLLEERQKFESLGCGFNNGVFYFGTKLFKNGKPFSAIVTSDKKLYVKKEIWFKDEEGKDKKKIIDEIRKNFGLNYKDDFFDEGIDNIFSKDAISKWLSEDCSNVTIKEVYEKLVNLFKKYIYFEDDRKYSLLACYRIAGFFMPVWRARARLFIFAEMGSAKSRLTQIMHNTGFNSIALGDWTLPYLQRLIESTKGETHIDDYETLDEDKKNATTRLVKTGFMKGFKAGKISDGKNKKPEVYDLFNTTTLNNTEGLDFISTDRTITIRIPKISKKEYDKEPNFTENIWKELRDKLYILGLKYPEEIAKTYETITSDKIRGRLFFIIKPELTIAKIISEDLYKKLEDFWVEEIGQRESIDYETDWEFLAYLKIYKLLSTLSTNSTLSILSTLSTTGGYMELLNDIVKPVGLSLYSEEDFKTKKRSMSIIIGNSLSRNPIFKKRQVKGKTQIKVDFEEFISLLEAKNFFKPIKEILEEKKVDKVDRVERVGSKPCIDINKKGNISEWPESDKVRLKNAESDKETLK